jgi:hypothetical protein
MLVKPGYHVMTGVGILPLRGIVASVGAGKPPQGTEESWQRSAGVGYDETARLTGPVGGK